MVPTTLEPDGPIVLPVKVFGMDANNRPFYQHATAHDLSAQGAVLEGLENSLRASDIVGVQYKEKKARARVVWACNLTIGTIRVGIQFLNRAECPWLETVEGASCLEASSVQEKRRHVRYRIRVGIEIREKDVSSAIHAQSVDLSLGGCYVETHFPLPIGTDVNLELWIGSERIVAAGSVRTSDTGVGMGIQFVNLSTSSADQLRAFLSHRIFAASRPTRVPGAQSASDDRPVGQ